MIASSEIIEIRRKLLVKGSAQRILKSSFSVPPVQKCARTEVWNKLVVQSEHAEKWKGDDPFDRTSVTVVCAGGTHVESR